MASLTKVNTILEDAKKLEGKKVLYFEGAGMDFYSNEQTDFSDVGNFRIRTSFLNNDGVQYYIELGSAVRYAETNKGKQILDSNFALRIDHLFKVEDRNKPELRHGTYEMDRDWKEIRKLNYNTKDITEWINENLNCSFDTIHVLDEFYSYRVHGGQVEGMETYNLMENIELDHETVNKQREAFNKYYKSYTKYRKFPCLSVIEKGLDFIKIRTSDSDKMLRENNLQREVIVNI